MKEKPVPFFLYRIKGGDTFFRNRNHFLISKLLQALNGEIFKKSDIKNVGLRFVAVDDRDPFWMLLTEFFPFQLPRRVERFNHRKLNTNGGNAIHNLSKNMVDMSINLILDQDKWNLAAHEQAPSLLKLFFFLFLHSVESFQYTSNFSLMQELFVILDANSIMHRSYHALPPLKTRSGELVNAVYGFSSILMTILLQEKPAYIATAFDTAAPTFRHVAYKEYKAGRVKAPQEFYDQIPRIEEIVRVMNIPIFRQEGIEADDIIGTIVKKNEREHPNVINKIITSDMDAMQLVSEKTCVGSLHKGYKASESFDPEAVFKKYGITPAQVIDYKALVGDSSDNIPGVKGIGKVSALELLEKFKTLDGIYAHLSEVKGKRREILEAQKKEAYFSQELATIKLDCDLPYTLPACKTHDFDQDKVKSLFDSLQFYSLIRRLGEYQKTHGLSRSAIAEVFPEAKKSAVDQHVMF